jgi:hypothetical protein
MTVYEIIRGLPKSGSAAAGAFCTLGVLVFYAKSGRALTGLPVWLRTGARSCSAALPSTMAAPVFAAAPATIF